MLYSRLLSYRAPCSATWRVEGGIYRAVRAVRQDRLYVGLVEHTGQGFNTYNTSIVRVQSSGGEAQVVASIVGVGAAFAVRPDWHAHALYIADTTESRVDMFDLQTNKTVTVTKAISIPFLPDRCANISMT
jgi:hypothetical protein